MSPTTLDGWARIVGTWPRQPEPHDVELWARTKPALVADVAAYLFLHDLGLACVWRAHTTAVARFFQLVPEADRATLRELPGLSAPVTT